jgi:formylmethanofuran dehydrogenase subunit C
MSLSLTYQSHATVPVEIEGVVPDRLRGRSVGEIERLDVFCGNRKLHLGDLFRVGGNPDDGRIDFEGDLGGVHFIGYGMADGEIFVHGDAGRHVGATMTGGRITVAGNASDWVGGEMHGGLIHVRGSAGNLIGAAYRGSKRGMTGGTILIGGDVGDEVGAAMRRGTLAVGGSCGDAAGFSMIAGTIVVFGGCGIRLGAGMKRGTIGVFGPEPIELLSTFRAADYDRPLFFRLLFRELAKLGFAVDPGLLESDLMLYHGDLIALGKGEVWTRRQTH